MGGNVHVDYGNGMVRFVVDAGNVRYGTHVNADEVYARCRYDIICR